MRPSFKLPKINTFLRIGALCIFSTGRTSAQRREGVTFLELSVEYGNLDLFQALIEHGADIHGLYDGGTTHLLHSVAEFGNSGMIQYLLEGNFNIDVHALDSRGRTVLHAALENSQLQLETIQLLIKHHVNINSVDNLQQTPLYRAIENDIPSNCLQALINYTAIEHLDTQRWDGLSLLNFAIDRKNLGAIRCLIVKGFDVNAFDNNGITPLHRAASINDFEIINYLVDSGANANAIARNGQSPLVTYLNAHLQLPDERIIAFLSRQTNSETLMAILKRFPLQYKNSPLYGCILAVLVQKNILDKFNGNQERDNSGVPSLIELSYNANSQNIDELQIDHPSFIWQILKRMPPINNFSDATKLNQLYKKYKELKKNQTASNPSSTVK